MDSTVIHCLRCRQPLPRTACNSPEPVPCPFCETLTITTLFPALFRPATPVESGDRVLADNEASCYHHPDRKALVVCDHCGRFLCTLCEVEFHDQHLCAACLETDARRDSSPPSSLSRHAVLYDSIALTAALLPIISFVFILFSPILSLLALSLAVWFWNAPHGVRPRSKLRFLLAILLAGLQLLFWVIFVIWLMIR